VTIFSHLPYNANDFFLRFRPLHDYGLNLSSSSRALVGPWIISVGITKDGGRYHSKYLSGYFLHCFTRPRCQALRITPTNFLQTLGSQYGPYRALQVPPPRLPQHLHTGHSDFVLNGKLPFMRQSCSAHAFSHPHSLVLHINPVMALLFWGSIMESCPEPTTL
jgi:hypothetical protein